MTKTTWEIARTNLFIIIGLMNTVMIRSEEVGSFKNYLGGILLILGYFDALNLIIATKPVNDFLFKLRRHLVWPGMVMLFAGMFFGIFRGVNVLFALVISGMGIRLLWFKINQVERKDAND
jgi:hypothetical protein